MANRSSSKSDTNTSPEGRTRASEDAGADLTRSVAGNIIERHSLAQQDQRKQRPGGDAATPETAEVAAEQGAGSLEAIQQGGQMRDIGSQAALENDGEASIDNARHQRIAIAAYYRAEQRGFEPGHEIEDWIEAEREVGEREGSGAVG